MEESPLILLLGGAGYIGTHIMLELHGQQVPGSRKGHRYQVAILDRRPPSQTAVDYAEKQAEGLKVLVYIFDLELAPYLAVKYPAMPRPPYCGIMLAALKDVNEGEVKPYDYIRSNIALCVNSMEYLIGLGTQRFIQASSSTVYHTSQSPAGRSEGGEPIGTYGYTKRVSEDICRRLAQGRQLLILRYMNPIGSHSEVDAFPDIGICQKLVSMKPGETFINRGNCVRDYIHISDLAAFHSYALEAWDDTLFHEGQDSVVTLDVGTGIRVTVAELVKAFGSCSGHGEKNIIRGERLKHEGYDTVGCTDETMRLIPNWSKRRMKDLSSSMLDYLRLHCS